MNNKIPITLGTDATARLVQYCQAQKLDRFLLVADGNTYTALGQRVETELRAHNWDVRTAILDGKDVLADERRIFDVLFRAHGAERVYLAVGSGTITDIVRYASFCARNPFISLPTAPSVDAYAAGGAALVMGGFKLTVPCQAPAAIFADLAVLCEAPPDMIAAGFGDILGKYTSLADWKLGALLLKEEFSPEISARSERALLDCAARAAEIGQASPAGITALMNGLIESGLCMMDFGSSRPASGAEHLLSHFWEIKLMQEGRSEELHGAKVGIGAVLIARRYETIRSLSRQEAIGRLSASVPPRLEDEITLVRATYGAVAERIVANHRPYLERLEASWPTLQQRIIQRWEQIEAIAASVPPAKNIMALLEQAGAPNEPAAIGLNEEDVQQALAFSHYMRGRFTVDTLGRMLRLW
jgi:glycerol-1-phosphate dehydrogenase [NAD(P)+]